ncbi:MAG: response regulator [Hyphomicrobiaceae bacterium]|nr:response regulator [Hyphomicrobiaceae bacterium]
MRAPEDLTVLIVDDNDYGRILLSTSLERVGVGRVEGVKDAVKALDFLRSNKTDIVLMDWYMPEISGAGLVRLMRQFGYDVPVVVCTAYATRDNVRRIKDLGLQHALVKPFEDGVMLRTIWAALRDHDHLPAAPVRVEGSVPEEDDQIFL